MCALMADMKEHVTRTQIITWTIAICTCLLTLGITAYFNIDSRIRANEILTHKIEVELKNKADRTEKAINDLNTSVTKMTELLNTIDKKVDVNAAKITRKNGE